MARIAATLDYEQAMRALVRTYPEDDEAQIFFALALTETALMNAVMNGDTSLDRQIEAGEILERLWRTHPDHPGIPHYIIHAYDDPRLARRALEAANRYGDIAPSAPHALHMPSHTYATLGMWEESIRANEASMAAAKALTQKTAPGNHDPAWLHAMDFLTFDYLQYGQDHKSGGDGRRALSCDQAFGRAGECSDHAVHHSGTLCLRTPGLERGGEARCDGPNS